MIKTTILRLLNTVSGLQHLNTQPFKGSAAFKVHRLIQKAQPEIANACKARDTLFTEINSDPGPTKDSPRVLKAECVAAVLADPLMSTVVEIDCDPLTHAMLETIELSPSHIESLGPLLADE